MKRWTEKSREFLSHLKKTSAEMRQHRLLELRDAVVQYQFMVTMKEKYASTY